MITVMFTTTLLLNYRKILRFERIAKHKGFFFTPRLLLVNIPSADWLSDPTTQLKAFVGGVRLQRKRFFFNAVFSK